MLARKLLDDGEAQTAYRVARDAAIPARRTTAPSINSPPAGSRSVFSTIPRPRSPISPDRNGTSNPIALARAGYWQGRAAEALGRRDEARTQYQAAARYSTAYYGQIARARLGLKSSHCAPRPLRRRTAPGSRSCARSSCSTRSRSATGRDLAADLGERASDAAVLAAIAEVDDAKRRARHAAARQARARARPAART